MKRTGAGEAGSRIVKENQEVIGVRVSLSKKLVRVNIVDTRSRIDGPVVDHHGEISEIRIFRLVTRLSILDPGSILLKSLGEINEHHIRVVVALLLALPQLDDIRLHAEDLHRYALFRRDD